MTLTAKTVARHLPAYQELYRLYLRALIISHDHGTRSALGKARK